MEMTVGVVRNTSDGSTRAPHLRCYLNLMSLEDLPSDGSGPRTRETSPLFEEIKRAGYGGVQFVGAVTSEQQAACERLGLGKASLGRVNHPTESDGQLARFRDEGVECATLHLGWGMEDDDEGARLIDSVLDGSARHGVPVYLETHRATIFQDIWRTIQFVKRFPDIRFNGDFSHWYTGQELVYGSFEKKLQFIQPVIDRVRFIHGRIGSPGCMQVAIDENDEESYPFVSHFRRLWTASFVAFLRSAKPGDYILFVPELLSAKIYYAREFRAADGNVAEESDRWQQSLVLRRISQQCFAEALQATHQT